MKKSPDIRLDLDTSREVAARDGNIQVLVNGRTEKIGSSYILSASLVDPGNGVALRSFSEEASTPEGVLLAARHVSAAIRRALGEHDWTATPPKLERATTRSLRALQLYSQGIALGNQRQWKAAAALFHEAVNEDPEFASAHVYLAHSHANLGKFPPAQHHFEVAFRLADTTSERERHFIRGSYYDFVGEEDKAIEAFRVLVELYPDDFWGVNNLALEYFYFGRLDEALPYFIRRAELPNDLGTVYRAWRELRRSGRDAGKAEALFDQTQTLSQQPDADPIIWATITLDGVRRQLCLGDYSGALQELERVRSSLPSHIGPRRTALSERLGRYFFDLGKLRAAEEQFSTLPEDWKHEALAYLAEEHGDMAALRFHLRRQLPIDENVWIVRQLALAGMTAQAAPLLIGQRAQLSYEPRLIDLARSAIFLAEGKTVEAIDLLTRLHQDATVSRDEIVLLVAIPLAEALEQRGDLSSAANVLTRALQANPLPENIRDLRKAKFHLSRLYRKLDREKEARALEAEVRQSLAVADADHPILRAMELDLHIRASR
jgi:tetratricopeptide (TPR) repeat protein